MSWTSNLRKLHARSWSERVRLIEAFIRLGLMRAALGRWPFRRIAARLGLMQTETPLVGQVPNIAEATRIGWAVKAAASRTPWPSTCLVQALAGIMMLRRRHISGTLYLGVAKDKLGPEQIAAHAWLASGDVVLIGENERERFKVISCFSTSADRFPRGCGRFSAKKD